MRAEPRLSSTNESGEHCLVLLQAGTAGRVLAAGVSAVDSEAAGQARGDLVGLQGGPGEPVRDVRDLHSVSGEDNKAAWTSESQIEREGSE